MIQKVSTPLEEQETIINIAPVQVEERVNIYSSATTMLAKLWKLYEKHPEDVELIKDDKYGSEFTVPRDWILIKPKRKYSEEQKQVMAERLKGIRSRKR